MRAFSVGCMLVAALLSMQASRPAQATSDDLPLCETSTGSPGRVFVRSWSGIAAPENVNCVETSRDSVRVVLGANTPIGPLLNAKETGPETLTLYEGETVRLTCKINVIAFDPARHDLSDLGDEGCDLMAGPDRPVLSGITNVVKLSKPLIEVATGAVPILKLGPISNRTVYLSDIEPGATNFAVGFDDSNNNDGSSRAVYRVCPVMVQDAEAYLKENPIQSEELCVGTNGTPARLLPGEEMLIPIPGHDPSSELLWSTSNIVNSERFDPRTTKITALAKGTTNILYVLRGRHHDAIECWVIVE